MIFVKCQTKFHSLGSNYHVRKFDIPWKCYKTEEIFIYSLIIDLKEDFNMFKNLSNLSSNFRT